MKLIDRVLPSVIDILDSKIMDHPATISEIFEQLEKHEYYEHLEYYIIRNLIFCVYGDDTAITDSKLEILFED